MKYLAMNNPWSMKPPSATKARDPLGDFYFPTPLGDFLDGSLKIYKRFYLVLQTSLVRLVKEYYLYKILS